MLQVVEVHALEHLEAIRLRWTSLLYGTPGASFFHTLDWLQVYWRHFRDGQPLRVLLVYRGGSLLGILPLVMRNEATASGPVKALTYPTIHPSHFLGPIGPNPTATLMASCRYLAGQSRDWDLLSLTSFGEHDHGRTANALELAGFHPHEAIHASVAKICFDGSWPDASVRWRSKAVGRPRRNDSTALGGHRTKETSNPGTLAHITESAGEFMLERIRPLGSTYGDDQPTTGLVEACLSLDRHSPFAEPSPKNSAAFLQDVAATASRLGMLDLNLLKLDGRLIAFSLNVHFDGYVQEICTGETAEPLCCDAGSLLTLRMLQDSVLREDHCIYFAGSHDGVKNNRTAAQHVPVVRYRHRAAMPLGQRLTRFGRWLASPWASGAPVIPPPMQVKAGPRLV